MIRYTTGDILKAEAEALVNTVNCVGVMGRGIALAFAWGGYDVALIDLKPRDAAAREQLAREAQPLALRWGR